MNQHEEKVSREIIENHFIYENKTDREIRIIIMPNDNKPLGINDFTISLGSSRYHVELPYVTNELLDVLEECK